MEKEGWEVKAALSAEKARNVIADYTPDIIIMDVIMTGKHGYHAIEDIISHTHLKNVPIV